MEHDAAHIGQQDVGANLGVPGVAPPRQPFAHNFAVACLISVQDYREGRKGKVQVVHELVQAVGALRDNLEKNPEDELDRALGTYVGMLDDFDRSRAAAVRGTDGPGQDYGRNEDHEELPNEDRGPAIRGRVEDADGDGPRKRRIIDNFMPFRIGNDPTLSAALRRTHEAVEGFAHDPASAKGRILRCPTRPDFPGSLWGEVLTNSFVDLDKVFDFHYATAGEGKRVVHQIGDIQLISDPTKVDRHAENGSSRGRNIKTPYFLSSHIATGSSPPTDRTSRTPSLPTLTPQTGSSSTIGESGPVQLSLPDSSSRTSLRSSPIINTSSSIPEGALRPGVRADPHNLPMHSESSPPRSAEGSTLGLVATLERENTATLASNAGSGDTHSRPAVTELPVAMEDSRNENKYPRFTRGFLWELGTDSCYVTPSASATERASPLPGPPTSVLQDPDTIYTLTHHSHLFRVVTPIDVGRFASLLESHPNRPFVDSVIRGLTEGFGLPADDDPALYPSERDFPERPLSPASARFCADQCERAASGPLLPGMISVPVTPSRKSLESSDSSSIVRLN